MTDSLPKNAGHKEAKASILVLLKCWSREKK